MLILDKNTDVFTIEGTSWVPPDVEQLISYL